MCRIAVQIERAMTGSSILARLCRTAMVPLPYKGGPPSNTSYYSGPRLCLGCLFGLALYCDCLVQFYEAKNSLHVVGAS